MAPLISNGIYKIRNCEHEPFVADLPNGIPRGPIVAFIERPYNRHDRWMIRNIGSGGNQIIIENVSRPGTFANPKQEGSDSSLVGSHHRTIWTVIKAEDCDGKSSYMLQSPDAEYVWKLPIGVNYEPILLVHHTGQGDTRWIFEYA